MQIYSKRITCYTAWPWITLILIITLVSRLLLIIHFPETNYVKKFFSSVRESDRYAYSMMSIEAHNPQPLNRGDFLPSLCVHFLLKSFKLVNLPASPVI